MEEITSRFVEMELDCDSGELWYRVITYHRDGRVEMELINLGEGFNEKELEALFQVLGGSKLRNEIALSIGGEAEKILEGKEQIKGIRIKGEEEQIEK